MDYERINREEQGPALSLAEVLTIVFDPACVMDVGCATGLYLKGFFDKGIVVSGIDTSLQAKQLAVIPDEYIWTRDITEPLPEYSSRWDLVLCLETLEHIEERHTDQVLDNLCALSDTIVFSAAIPGQGGEGHVNCQPKAYWIKRFRARGYKPSQALTSRVLKAVKQRPYWMGWLVQNLIIFVKGETSKMETKRFRMHLLGLAHVPSNRAVSACASADTEILTEHGWMLLGTLVEEQLPIKVATLNLKTEQVEYQQPTHYIGYQYQGKMLHIYSQSSDLLVTPDHRMLITSRSSQSYAKAHLVEATDLPKWPVYLRGFPYDPPGGDDEIEPFILPEYHSRCKHCPSRKIEMGAWLRLFGIWLAEGNIDYGRWTDTNGEKYRNPSVVSIAQEKPDNRVVIARWIHDAGYPQPSVDSHCFRICDVQIANYLERFGHARDKYIPREYLALPKPYLKMLLEALLMGDGQNIETGAYRYYTFSAQLADDVGELALRLGYTVTQYSGPTPTGTRYIVTLSPRQHFHSPNPGSRQWVNYEGMVYCVTVPNETIFLRRNGKTIWTGNCAYTQKALKLSKMLLDMGHEVFFYGGEGSDVECTEYTECISAAERDEVYGKYDWRKEFFKHDGKDGAYTLFAEHAIEAINTRKEEQDFLLVTMGNYQQPIADAVNLMTVESGIGYKGIFAQFKVFESYTWMAYVYGLIKQGDGSWYDCVIPNYFDPDDFPFQPEKDDYFLYIGRLVKRKGIEVAVQVTKEIGARLIVAGQGTLTNTVEGINITDSHVEHIGCVGPEERKELMGRARAVLVPTTYQEPFGGVAVEAMMCGTPVITTDWGVFSETVLSNVTGYRCRTFNEFVHAARNIDDIKPKDCHEWAIRNYSMERVAQQYQAYFEQLYDLWEKGWYELHDNWAPNRYQKWYLEPGPKEPLTGLTGFS